ncbi:hypothetical protein I4U23_018819 [Adineta vaga]|nr:hypothetical protein I4U23_018819 [Adineta vaga]
MNMFGPKPFRSTASINLDKQNSNEIKIAHTSPIEAFRKMLDPSNSISKSMNNETTNSTEQQSPTILKITTRETAITPPPNSVSISSDSTYTSSSNTTTTTTTAKVKAPPPPLTSVESLLHGTSDNNNHEQHCNESLIVQARSSVEQQMNQLQQELLRNYPHTQASRDQRSVNIPIDTSNVIKLSSYQQQDSSSTNNNNRIYGIKVNSNETSDQTIDSSNSQRISPSYPKRSIQDIPSLFTNTATSNTAINHPSTTHSTDRTVNEIKINLLTPTSNQQQQQQQKKSSILLDEKKTQQRITNKQLHTTFNQVPKKPHHDDHSWINNNEQNKSIVPPPSQQQTLTNKNGKSLSNHRPPPPIPQQQDVQKNISTSKQLSMFHYGDTSDDLHYRPLRSAQHQHDVEPSIHRQHQLKNRPKSPVRTTINSNNNRVLSVSGKLHCSKCNEELGQGSAMVIESLGLYYHIECFRCFVCNIPLSSSFEGTDVRVRTNRLHCQNCFSDENGVKSSAV